MVAIVGFMILACEIAFWIFVLSGLSARYLLQKKKLGSVLLYCTPLVDLALLIFVVFDLKNGASANTFHGLAAVYLGVSIAFGKKMIHWADQHFAYRFANGEKPQKKKVYGKEYAKLERQGWYRHFLAWLIGACFLLLIVLYIQNLEQTFELIRILFIWSIVLIIDFFISFSYTIFPKKEA